MRDYARFFESTMDPGIAPPEPWPAGAAPAGLGVFVASQACPSLLIMAWLTSIDVVGLRPVATMSRQASLC